MIDSILYMCITAENREASLHHHARWWIFLGLLLPEDSGIAIIPFTIYGECLRIPLICIEILGVTLSSEKFEDLDSLSFSFCSDRIEFPNEKSRIEGIPRILRDDDIHRIFLADAFESGCYIHGITEDRVVEPFF